MGAGGEGGIRTLGSLLDYGALAKRCFRPLSHLTNAVEYGGDEMPVNVPLRFIRQSELVVLSTGRGDC